MLKILFPFTVYDGVKGEELIGFGEVNGNVCYEHYYEEVKRIDDDGYFYAAKKNEKWYKLSSDNIEVLSKIPESNNKKSECSIFLKKSEFLYDATDKFYIIRNNFGEEFIYNNEDKLIFDPWTHYKNYMIDKYGESITTAEDYLKKLNKLKRNQLLNF